MCQISMSPTSTPIRLCGLLNLQGFAAITVKVIIFGPQRTFLASTQKIHMTSPLY